MPTIFTSANNKLGQVNLKIEEKLNFCTSKSPVHFTIIETIFHDVNFNRGLKLILKLSIPNSSPFFHIQVKLTSRKANDRSTFFPSLRPSIILPNENREGKLFSLRRFVKILFRVFLQRPLQHFLSKFPLSSLLLFNAEQSRKLKCAHVCVCTRVYFSFNLQKRFKPIQRWLEMRFVSS